MSFDFDHSSQVQNSGPDKLPSQGIAIFFTSAPPTLRTTHPADLKVVVSDDQIDQTGIVPQNNGLFSLQITLTQEGARNLSSWFIKNETAPLFLAIDGKVASSAPLVSANDGSIELTGLGFSSVYSIAASLGYDTDTLQGLEKFDLPGEISASASNASPEWKIVAKQGEFLGDRLDDIQEILNNRAAEWLDGSFSIRRVQSALYCSASAQVAPQDLQRLVATMGRVTIFSSQSPLRAADPIPANAVMIFTQDQIEYADLENAGHWTLLVELTPEGSEFLETFQKQYFGRPLYLALDGFLTTTQKFIIAGDSRLEMDDLPEKEAGFFYAILDNDPLPAALDLAAAGPQPYDENSITWKVVPNEVDSSPEVLEEIFTILNNRAKQIYAQQVTVERAQSSLRVNSGPAIEQNQLIRMISTLGKAVLFSTTDAVKAGQPIPRKEESILDESAISSVTLEITDPPALFLQLTPAGVDLLASYHSSSGNPPLYISLDGRIVSAQPVKDLDGGRLSVIGLPAEELQFMAAILDNDLLPVSLSVSPITISRADESYIRGFNELWLVKTADGNELSLDDWENIQSILANRLSMVFQDATSVEYEGGRLTIIPDLHTNLDDLESLVKLRGQVTIFQSAFEPESQQPLPPATKSILTEDEITGISLEGERNEISLEIKMNAAGAAAVQNLFQFNASARLYLAVDGQVASPLALVPTRNSSLVLENLSSHDARFWAAILDNDVLPCPLVLSPLTLDQDSQFTPEEDQIWYVESAEEDREMTSAESIQIASILNERAKDLLNGLVSFEPDEDWGILVQFTYPDTPINLGFLEQVVTKSGEAIVITSASAPAKGEQVGSSKKVILTSDQILEAQLDQKIGSGAIKLILSKSAKALFSTSQGLPLFLALDGEILSPYPLTWFSEDVLEQHGLDEETQEALLLLELINHKIPRIKLQLNMDQETD